ncbi:Sensor histidine kinase TodS [Rickettsia endosymbiont of Cardiosporidium cionae]|nr:Sensor histidine kinase TodS [Rickettsia endosymbiont of Cardiosporidium cionae]
MNLLSNLLDLSKLNADKMTFCLKKNNLQKVISEVISEFSYLPNHVNIELKVLTKSNILLNFDYERIAQVIRNIIANAVKYGNDSDIIVAIKEDNFAVINNPQQKGIKTSITDQGVGIPQSELEDIFVPFIESSRTRSKTGGTGLGLAICHEIITAHKGYIGADSNGKKTTFFFILPLIHKKIMPHIKFSNNIYNVLIVDDDKNCLTACSIILSSLGYKVFTALGGKNALAILKKCEERIDIILVDIMMDEMCGISLLRKIKSTKNITNIPIIIQSGLFDRKEIDKAYKCGAIGFIPKPYNKDNINYVINSLVK